MHVQFSERRAFLPSTENLAMEDKASRYPWEDQEQNAKQPKKVAIAGNSVLHLLILFSRNLVYRLQCRLHPFRIHS